MTSTVPRSERTLSFRELSTSASAPVASVVANLMPAEVLAKRRNAWLRRRLMLALVALVLLVGMAYAYVRQQTSGYQDDLAAAQTRTAQQNSTLRSFDELTRLQAEIARLRSQLASVMAGDLRWSALTTTLNARAPRGLRVTGVHGTIGEDDAAESGTGTATPKTIGTLELSGSAKDYRSVAAFVDALGKVPGLGQVDPGSVSTAEGALTFSITASLTTEALGGRFTTPTSATPAAGSGSTGGSR